MNPISVPPWWESLLKKYLKKTFYVGTRKKDFADREQFTEGDYRFFANGVRKLSLAFTQERHFLPKNYLNQKELRSGYLFYFLPVNALKVAALLQQNVGAPFIAPGRDESRPYTILDIGSGPGTGMFGLFLYLDNLLRKVSGGKRRIQLRWILIDQNRQSLEDARELHQEIVTHLKKENPDWPIDSEVRLVVGDFFKERISRILPPEPVDLVLALNFLNELHQVKRLPLIEGLVRDHLRPEGRILAMEPALRSTTRNLMALHDEIVTRRLATVYAPCLHQAACPMLQANQRDWCHTYIPWLRPPWLEKMDGLVGIRKDYLKCSYLILGPPLLTQERAGERSLWRVVSGHLNSKGKSELLLCGPGALPSLYRAVRLDRDGSEKNRAFDKIQRGEVLKVQKVDRIRKETAVS